MTRPTEQAAQVAYPQLDRATIDLIISALVFYDSNHVLDADSAAVTDKTLAYLISFHTRRWGLPAAITGHTRLTPAGSSPPR